MCSAVLLLLSITKHGNEKWKKKRIETDFLCYLQVINISFKHSERKDMHSETRNPFISKLWVTDSFKLLNLKLIKLECSENLNSVFPFFVYMIFLLEITLAIFGLSDVSVLYWGLFRILWLKLFGWKLRVKCQGAGRFLL